ncbi:MAG: hypothetical protein OXG84_06075 [Chloroflexi bacterium]|nr:hypothetical protein [Chloroflexota bacterium]
MLRYIRTAIGLVLLASIMGTVSGQDATICKALRAIHTIHGEQFLPYLSDIGQQCLEPAATPTPLPTATPVPAIERIWRVNGRGPSERSVSLNLTPGVYELKEPLSPSAARGGFAWLTNIISVPDACFVWEDVTFPAIVRIERHCQIYATLEVSLGVWADENRRWELSITKVSDEVETPKADGWTIRGRNFGQIPVDLVFAPGIYRTKKRSGQADARMWIISKSRDRCLTDYNSSLPNQFRVTQSCRIKAYIRMGYWGEYIPSWSIEITKLN